MTHAAKILADSITTEGHRLTTFEVTFPRIVLAEFNTHRMLWGTEGSDYPEFSRNSASSRAIPVEKMIKMVEENPYVPTHWGKNQKGMQAEEELGVVSREASYHTWLAARDHAVKQATTLLDIGVHKQITNRLLEPFMWHTVIVTATEWGNWFHLRDNSMAHPEIKLAAELMRDAMEKSTPLRLDDGQWHLPLCSELWQPANQYPSKQEDLLHWRKISVGRCARVSYLTHDGQRNLQADSELHDRLLEAGHMSPFEHVARPMTDYELERATRIEVLARDEHNQLLFLVFLPEEDVGEVLETHKLALVRERETAFCGNFQGWVQHRKLILGEEDILGYRDSA